MARPARSYHKIPRVELSVLGGLGVVCSLLKAGWGRNSFLPTFTRFRDHFLAALIFAQRAF